MKKLVFNLADRDKYFEGLKQLFGKDKDVERNKSSKNEKEPVAVADMGDSQ